MKVDWNDVKEDYKRKDDKIEALKQQLATTKQDSLISLEEALKAMLINGFSDDCVPVVKVKYQIKKLKGEV
jgi:hypothetical protein